MTLTLEAEALVAGRGGQALVGPLDVRLTAGEVLLVTGENGVGKSTLLRTLSGHLPALSGRLRIAGFRDAEGEAPRRLAEIAHVLGHRNAMKAQESVAANLAFWARYLGPAAGAGLSPAAALEAVGLGAAAGLPFGYLSAGQQRRAALARLLVIRRPVWLLDEPTAALDAASQALFAGLVAAHVAAGGIVIAATHQPLGVAARELRLAPSTAAPGGAAGSDLDEVWW